MDWTEEEKALADRFVRLLRASGPYVENNPVDMRRVMVDGECDFLLLARSAVESQAGPR